jgi:hypothetical protein
MGMLDAGQRIPGWRYEKRKDAGSYLNGLGVTGLKNKANCTYEVRRYPVFVTKTLCL